MFPRTRDSEVFIKTIKGIRKIGETNLPDRFLGKKSLLFLLLRIILGNGFLFFL